MLSLNKRAKLGLLTESEKNQFKPKPKSIPFAILCVGAEGVGKTALARELDRRLRSLGYNLHPLLNEAARSVLTEAEIKIPAMRINPDLTDTYQRAVFDRQLSEEKRRVFAGYVADRSLADNLAYLAEHGLAIADLIEDQAQVIEEYKKTLRRQLVFHVTPSREIYDQADLKDGVRAVGSWDSIVRIDAIVKFILRSWRCPVNYVTMANMSERIEHCMKSVLDKIG